MEDPHQQSLVHAFEAARPQLRAVAFRMLGTLHEADDALQEAWLRASRSELQTIASIPAWLTTIVGRICLDVLRARRRRAEESLDMPNCAPGRDPEDELSWVQDVGSALMVVMDTLGPAERVAFVLHDLLGQPIEAIAQVVERTPAAAKKLASRARARVLARPPSDATLLEREHGVIAAFLDACRAADVERIATLLAPDVVRRTHLRGQPTAALRGARTVAREALSNTRAARLAEIVEIDGSPGLCVAPRGRLAVLLRFVIRGDRIVVMDVISDAALLTAAQIRLFQLQGARCFSDPVRSRGSHSCPSATGYSV